MHETIRYFYLSRTSTVEKDKEYLTLAHQYGFTRVFTCLLSVDGEKENIVKEFKETISHANELGFQVLVDISPAVFEQLGISYNDLFILPRIRCIWYSSRCWFFRIRRIHYDI